MARCCIHPGREAAGTAFGDPYCKKCLDGQAAAVKSVEQDNVHVEPKSCFLIHKSHDEWVPFSGTGCAHWVAHQLNISKGAAWNKCMLGFTIRVPDAIRGKSEVPNLSDVKINDIWANSHKTHMGIVSKASTDQAGVTTILITHDSSRQGGVHTNDFATYFHKDGKFYR